jgi:hypothetical protein
VIPAPPRLARRLLAGAAAVLALIAVLLGVATPASAHVVPTSLVVLDVHSSGVDGTVRIPLDDLEAATGIDLGDDPSAALGAHASAIRAYLRKHMSLTSADGTWTTSVGALHVGTSEQLGTGEYPVLTAAITFTSSAGAEVRRFVLHDDAIVHRVVTHQILVSVRQDWASGQVGTTRSVGSIQVDTVTGAIPTLTVDLGTGSAWQGSTGMVSLGASHILEGTDHQLFLLTLLLPAPLLVAGRRWAGAGPPRRAARRIASITLAFTVGHSITLAVGTLGVVVPQGPVEALIAVSILVAAVHAARPIFPGREALVAGSFGLIHGLAFSATLRELDLSGGELVLSLLGFNLGIELMQLVIVVLVLPPLCVLARTASFARLRLGAAALTGVAAIGWLLARIGVANAIAGAADGLLAATPWLVVVLWGAAAWTLLRRRSGRPGRSVLFEVGVEGRRSAAGRGSPTVRLAPLTGDRGTRERPARGAE